MGQGDFSARISINRVDEIGRLAQTLDYMAIQLEALEQTRQEFLANVSHELRTPLTSIRGFAQGILDGTVPAAEQPAYLARIYTEAERLSEIVDDLLTLARLSSGHLQFNWTDIAPAALLSEVVEICGPVATGKNVKLDLSAANSNKTIRADPQRLAQAFINIIDNVIKFSPQSGAVHIQSGWRAAERLRSFLYRQPLFKTRICRYRAWFGNQQTPGRKARRHYCRTKPKPAWL